jgi:hypothetical protein
MKTGFSATSLDRPGPLIFSGGSDRPLVAWGNVAAIVGQVQDADILAA